MSTIVMTGGTSGFGAIAAERLARSKGVRLILGARRPAATGGGELLPLDLAELASVRAFAESVRERLGGAPVDALLLNAGMILPSVTGRTTDGFETTFAVNHLAPYLLARLLLPVLADKATVVLTTSGTHDPATGASLAPPRHADAELLAHPDRDPGLDPRPRKAGEHAYTAAKLCAVLTARSLAGIGEGRLTVVAYDPGQVFGTGLAKDLPFPLRMAWSVLGSPVLRWPLGRLDPHLNSRAAAGHTLADLALGLAIPPDGHVYAALRRARLTWPDPSETARADEPARALWEASARLVGLRD
ncbi:NAD(P)-dependent dehydrogenase (short-subunit alcohol dehydrogenase family) [Nonomuraea thailandensis]|uniref:NAD(P)-dependent dehydrogenase (Short-subunit alcohol dehydrogenase family) n=1 Tax=Nonomuraea thailandensis TaxID=1188745 RepID=A0A9X2GHJ9_9ACTN|nr:SDR family NAD(P)-dependent oxidoreductase [Nonomuraea thailandensis]MCP2357770.1 NAD(P)-dependent dehydrogenase (short-subunit alcohol dehydrogenase family) [Nonomuraea thailandensis]